MSLEDKLKLVSQNCLHGRPVPRSLQCLWKAQEEGDRFLADVLEIKLLTSLEVLQQGYSEAIADGDSGILASLRAHQRVFERIGFFAVKDDGELWAFDFQSGSPTEPPVVELDTEGQYRWQGADVVEVIFRAAERLGKGQEARDQFEAQGFVLGDIGELGSTTQFFPSIQKFHDRLYYDLLQKPRTTVPSSDQPADPHDLFTWLLRPGDEVCRAIAVLRGLPAGSKPAEEWVWCDGEGRVTQIVVRNRGSSQEMQVKGVKLGMSPKEVVKLLGKPIKMGRESLTYRFDQGRLQLSILDNQVMKMCVAINKSENGD